ncbi:hypothetical protein PMAYCL1PPCAC_03096, partial [Pristionchus mayeri]
VKNDAMKKKVSKNRSELDVPEFDAEDWMANFGKRIQDMTFPSIAVPLCEEAEIEEMEAPEDSFKYRKEEMYRQMRSNHRLAEINEKKMMD